ncbi:MAG: hypothetical protein K2X01_11990 [Cyanobacteria bacterium]|nr:hypothetical protein [Cyanobacteriota bacterium]
MVDTKEKLAIGSTAALVGAVLPALISLNIFATKADLAEMRAEIAEKYVTQRDLEESVRPIIEKLDKFDDKMGRKLEVLEDKITYRKR